MDGPFAAGTLDCSFTPSEWSWESNRLTRDCSYRVIRSFVDADGDEHAIDEVWTFLGSMFSRLDDELTLCVRSPSREEWKIPLIWKPEEQQRVIEHFLDCVEEFA